VSHPVGPDNANKRVQLALSRFMKGRVRDRHGW
jgi:hypothetical protein